MALAEALVVTIVEIIVAAAAVKRRKRKMIAAAAVEEITTTMDADAEADMETIMDSLADLGGYSY